MSKLAILKTQPPRFRLCLHLQRQPARMTFETLHPSSPPPKMPNAMKECYHHTQWHDRLPILRMRSSVNEPLEDKERLLWQASQSLSNRATTQGLTTRGSSSS